MHERLWKAHKVDHGVAAHAAAWPLRRCLRACTEVLRAGLFARVFLPLLLVARVREPASRRFPLDRSRLCRNRSIRSMTFESRGRSSAMRRGSLPFILALMTRIRLTW